MSRRVLMIEDEPGLRVTVQDRLQAEGYVAECVADGEAGLARVAAFRPDLILLDVMLPGLDGFEVCRRLRAGGVSAPILMLTARGEVVDRVVGLKLGADDYLTKPFDMAELLARIEALLRRTPAATGPLGFADVRLDLERAEVRRGERLLPIAGKEFQLLQYFLEHPGEALSRDTLLANVWNYDNPPPSRTVDVHVAWLRQKLEANPKTPRYILTVHGIGYKFVP